MIKISSGKKKIKRILALPGQAAGRNWRRKENDRDGAVRKSIIALFWFRFSVLRHDIK